MDRYRFIIDVFKPDTIPMERLGQYMADLGRMLGESAHVHFREVQESSCALAYYVDPPGVNKVRARLEGLRNGRAPRKALHAFDQINTHLREDNASGRIDLGGNQQTATIIEFPGRETPPQATIGPVKQHGTLQGQVCRVGGTDKTIPIWIQGTDLFHCQTTRREIAQELAPYIYGPTIRVSGTGSWIRNDEGRWSLKSFLIESFETLDESSLTEIRERLRAAPASDWRGMDDPQAELLKLRHGDGDVH